MASQLLDEDFISKIERLELVSRKVVTGTIKGERRSRRRGQSTEFADHRPYVPGDDLRFLDWNIYGRLERLFLKIFLEEEELWLNLLLDWSPSMGFGQPRKFEYARKIIAALAYIGLVNQDRVQISGFDTGIRPVFGPARGRYEARRMLEVVEALVPREGTTTDLAESCRQHMVRGARSGITLLISDFLDRGSIESALRYLLLGGRSTEIFALHVLAPEEVHPEITGDLRLVDGEDGQTAEVTASAPLLRAYRQRLERFRSAIERYCYRHGIHYIFTSTSVPFDELVLSFLKTRGLVR